MMTIRATTPILPTSKSSVVGEVYDLRDAKLAYGSSVEPLRDPKIERSQFCVAAFVPLTVTRGYIARAATRSLSALPLCQSLHATG